MAPVDSTRRRMVKLAVLAAPVIAFDRWSAPGNPDAIWTTDGKFRFFRAPNGIHWADATGARGGLFLPLGLSFALTPGAVAPGNGHLAYTALDRRTGSNIWTAPILLQDENLVAGNPAAFFHSGAFDVAPRFLRNGEQLAYASRAAGQWRLQTHNFS